MKGFLSKNKIDYVFFHISQYFKLSSELKENIIFLDNPLEVEKYRSKIIFLLSEKEFRKEQVFLLNEVPVLFPISDQKQWFVFNNNNLIFQHDILKSSFFLLSCYQEYNSNNTDRNGRFLHSHSVQKEFNFSHKPLVNYYFSIIFEGLNFYCSKNNIPFIHKRENNKCLFLLSHDVDRVDYYSFNGFLLKCKELLNLTTTKYTFKQNLNLLIKQFFYLFVPKRSDPYWDFDYLLDIEKKMGIKSVFYFLHKDKKHYDGYYSFNTVKIKLLIKRLLQNGNEIGLHNSIGATSNLENTFSHLEQLQNVSSNKVIGVRQHYLKIKVPYSQSHFNNAGLFYDTSLCFAEHEGFRSSYCYPHKLYDFEADKMLEIWEIPLMIMDCTLFDYRELNFDEAFEYLQILYRESKKFGGIVTLLWHNGNFDEIRFPGIRKFYEKILEYFVNNCYTASSMEVIKNYNPKE